MSGLVARANRDMPDDPDAEPAARVAALVRALEGLTDNAGCRGNGEPASPLETQSIGNFEQHTLEELLASL